VVSTLLVDDVRNFLQRWIILKTFPDKVMLLLPPPPLSPLQTLSVDCVHDSQQKSDSGIVSSTTGTLAGCEAVDDLPFATILPAVGVVVADVQSSPSTVNVTNTNTTTATSLVNTTTATTTVAATRTDWRSLLSGWWMDPEEQLAHAL
jgi:hypothetical protein